MQPTPTSLPGRTEAWVGPRKTTAMRPAFSHFPSPSIGGLRRAALVAALVAAPVIFSSCRDAKVAVYQVPKEPEAKLPTSAPAQVAGDPAEVAPAPMPPPTATAPGAAGPHAALQTAGGSDLTWTTPAGWRTKAGSAMRKATYAVGDDASAPAELAISAFPGDVGGEVANVNRWRGQVGLPEISDTDAAAAVFRMEANGLKIAVVDVRDPSGPNASRLLGAMVPQGGATWFFKLVGPSATVEQAKPAFLEFLKTVKPTAASNP